VVEAEGLTIYLNITTTLEIVSDKVRILFLQTTCLDVHVGLTPPFFFLRAQLFHVLLTDVVFNSTVWAVLAGDIGVTVYVPLYNEITAWEYIAQPVSMNAMGGTVFGGAVVFLFVNLLCDQDSLLPFKRLTCTIRRRRCWRS